jgi:AcrR family transcriptional regulator
VSAGTASTDPADQSNRLRLLNAASEAFAGHGFDGTSIRSIADDAGVSFQLIAHYFGSKDDLWNATVEHLFTRYLETGRGLGFNTQGDVREQFRNHLRLLLSDMMQNPQLRKIWIQEHFARSERYSRFIKPQIKQLVDTLTLPYFKEVVRLRIVTRYSAEEVAIFWSGVVQLCVASPRVVEILLGLPIGSTKTIEALVDLAFRVLTDPAAPHHAWPTHDHAGQPATDEHIAALRRDNEQLKQMVGSAALEVELLSAAVRTQA